MQLSAIHMIEIIVTSRRRYSLEDRQFEIVDNYVDASEQSNIRFFVVRQTINRRFEGSSSHRDQRIDGGNILLEELHKFFILFLILGLVVSKLVRNILLKFLLILVV